MTRQINVKVKTRAKRRSVEETGPGEFKVCTNAAPADGKANEDVVDQLAEHFDVAKSDIELVSGHTSTRKVFRINTR